MNEMPIIQFMIPEIEADDVIASPYTYALLQGMAKDYHF